MVFRKSSTQYTPMGFAYDDDGTVWCYAIAHGALTTKTQYRILPYSYGFKTAAVASGTTLCMLGYPDKTYATGDLARMQVGGAINDAVTSSLTVSVDQYYGLTSGVFQSIGSFTANVMAMGQTAATSATANDFVLIPRWITPT
ncbi:MAG: hypothetical protein PHQ35_11375 [Phycisphaerae bacterium]|nr:hypothetical protein [Phycisphaerae bacterium]